MFYNRKAIQKRIILERYKDEDVDPTWYTGTTASKIQDKDFVILTIKRNEAIF